jgi:hypothetical protein
MCSQLHDKAFIFSPISVKLKEFFDGRVLFSVFVVFGRDFSYSLFYVDADLLTDENFRHFLFSITVCMRYFFANTYLQQYSSMG